MIKECRACYDPNLVDILSLGEMGLSDFIDKDCNPPVKKYPLDLVMCQKCSLLQLKQAPPRAELYTNRYGYRSGINSTMRSHLAEIADVASERANLDPGDIVLDIGCNDGTLLDSYLVPQITKVGFDPIEAMAEHSTQNPENNIFVDYFSPEPFLEAYGGKKARIITAISMFYDLEDPNEFLDGVKECLEPDGLFIIQQNYVGGMLKQRAFDNIVHEHLEYFSLNSLVDLLHQHDLWVTDVETNNLNGGSFRTYISHMGNESLINPAGTGRVLSMVNQEIQDGLNTPRPYLKFGREVDSLRTKIHDFVEGEVSKGKDFYLYGASTRGNTLLQACNLDSSLITAAAERNEDKWGKKTLATNIPIISETQARLDHPDYFFVLPWFFQGEFIDREQDYLKRGGTMLFPLPRPTLVSLSGEGIELYKGI